MVLIPIGAENIGTAYVRVIADGKDFDLNQMFDESFDADRAARRTSRSYAKAMEEEAKGPSWAKMQKTLTDNLVSMDAGKKFINSPQWKSYRESLINDHKDIGRLAGENLEQEILRGVPNKEILKRLKSIRRDLASANDQLVSASNQNERDQTLATSMLKADFAKRELKEQSEIARNAAAIRMDRERDERKYLDMLGEAAFLDRQFNLKRIFAIKNVAQANNDLIKTYRDVRKDIDMMTKGEVRHGISVGETAAKLRQLTVSLQSAGLFTREIERDVDRHHQALLRMHPTLNRYRNSLTGIADATGSAFGKGSRNNFLNFTGSLARGIVMLGGSVLSVAGYFSGLGRRMGAAGSVMGGLGVLAKDAARGLGVLGAGLLGLFGLIGPLTSILSGLGGMVLALASSMGGALLGAIAQLSSTLAFGLAGAAAIAGAALVPLGVGLGVLIAGLKNIDGPALAAVNHIKSSFSDLGVAAAEGLNFDHTQYEDSHNHAVTSFQEVLGRINEMVKDLRPLVVEIGRSMADALDILTLRLGGADGAFTKFVDAMSGSEGKLGPLAVQARLVGRTIGEAFGGLLGLLRALTPTTTNFLQFLRDAARDFNDFANSAAGQVTLKNFFYDAAESAAILGGFLSAVRTLLAEVFDQANADGNNLFESMTDGLLDWADALDKNPDIMAGWKESLDSFGDFVSSTRDLLIELLSAGAEVGDGLFGSLSSTIDGFVAKIRANPDILKDFYDSAGAFSRALGDVVVGLGKVFSALDNTFSRAFLAGTFEIVASLITGIATALEGIASLFGDGATEVQRFAGQVAAAAVVLPLLSKAMGVSAITGFITSMGTATTRTAALAGAAKGVAGIGGLLLITSAFKDVSKEGLAFGSVLKGVAGGAGIGFMLGGPMGALIGGVAGGGLVAIAGAFKDTAKEAAAAASTLRQKEGWANAKAGADSLADSLDGVINAYGKVPRAAIEASFTGKDGKLQGDIQQLRDLGVSMDTIVSATLGRADAIKIVNGALFGQIAIEREAEAAAKKAYETALAAANERGRGRILGEDVEDLKALEDAYVAAGGKVDALSESFAEFGAKVGANVTKVKEQRAEMVRLADQLGINLKQYKGFPKEVRTDFEARGLRQTAEDSLRLIGEYKKLQTFKNIKAIVTASGATLSFKQMKDLKRQYDLTPKQIKTLVAATGTQLTKGQIAELIEKAKEFDRQRPKPKIDVDASGANAAIAGVAANLAALRDKAITIRVNRVEEMAPATATGGIFWGSQVRTIGEAGAEAVVPLSRNLSQVDPSVRWLSAIAQGKASPMARGGVGGLQGKQVSADGWTIVSNSRDPEVVATEVMNRLVGAGY